jgi:nanoRNase/pAp phosphatase (c-di-AMP/oligoRNAs hydrolase)
MEHTPLDTAAEREPASPANAPAAEAGAGMQTDAEPEHSAQSASGRPAGGSEQPPAQRLYDLLANRRGERHAVAIQDFPDPDALSSALAYREIARGFEIEADVLHDGTISHPENLALVNLLELEIIRYDDAIELAEYDAAVFVDNQGTTTRLTGRLAEARVPTLAVIDHHDLQDVLDPLFVDIRPVGAAATIIAEYLESGVFCTLDHTNPRHVELATALMHGLHSETEGFIRAGDAEFAAAAFLTPFIDVDLLERVLCVQKSRGTMDTIQAALACRAFRGGFSVAGVGLVRWDDRDAIPQAADFLLTEENVHTAIVYGLLRDDNGREIVSGSLRTNNATLGVDTFLKRALGKDARGRPYGGGRTRAGGFEIDIGFLSGGDEPEFAESKWSLFDSRIRSRIFRAAGVGRERSGRAEQGERVAD